MKVKEFEAPSLRECLDRVRQELGDEAVILETRREAKGGVLGRGRRDAIRILAATGIAVTDSPVQAPAAAESAPEVSGSARPRRGLPWSRAATAYSPPEQPENSDSEPPGTPELGRIHRELADLRRGFTEICRAIAEEPSETTRELKPRSEQPAARSPILSALLQADLPESLANDLLASTRRGRKGDPERSVTEGLAERLVTGGEIALDPGSTKVVALVGATGVGKTTTIAKLAAQFALMRKRRVGLVTLDTYRVAAVEQLRAYSDIVSLPMQVAHSPAELPAALRTFQDYDLVLIDTAGRSQKNVMQVGELKALVEATGCETHLVLAASTKRSDMLDQLARFRQAGADRLLFSKLDETTTYGTMLGVAIESEIPLSYITTGQRVPEDIEVADAVRLAGLVTAGALAKAA